MWPSRSWSPRLLSSRWPQCRVPDCHRLGHSCHRRLVVYGVDCLSLSGDASCLSIPACYAPLVVVLFQSHFSAWPTQMGPPTHTTPPAIILKPSTPMSSASKLTSNEAGKLSKFKFLNLSEELVRFCSTHILLLQLIRAWRWPSAKPRRLGCDRRV